MTDRYNSLTVVLEKDMREDDAEDLITAVRMIKGVLSVECGIANPGDYIAEKRVKTELLIKLMDILN